MNQYPAKMKMSTRWHAASVEWTSRVAPLLAVAMLLPTLPGCSRGFWRQQADRDAYEAISERVNDPRWQLPRFDVGPDPDSRFFDPYDPDKGPLPPDDPAAHDYMHQIDGIGGYKSWHKMGDSFSIENPQWLARYGLSPEMMNPATGDYTGNLPTLQQVTLAECVELSQIHSRELQTQIEDLYLSALDLTHQRYLLGIRYPNWSGAARQSYFPFPQSKVIGGNLRHTNPNSTSLDTGVGIAKLLPAGGQIAVEIANTAVWTFSKTDGFSVSPPTTLSFQLTQPLVNGAGRKIVLENLTQQERNLLYQARTLARFRQSLFTNVVSDSTGSYLSLIQQMQVIRNSEQNIERTRNQVAILQSNASQKGSIARADLTAWPDGLVIPDSLKTQLAYDADDQQLLWKGRFTPEQQAELEALSTDKRFQIAVQELIWSLSVTPSTLDALQLQGQLASSIATLRTQQQTFQAGLDSLKLTLGLPPDIEVTIDDTMLEPFTIIDPRLSAIEKEVTDYIQSWAEIDEDDPTIEQLLAANSELELLIQHVEQDGLTIVDQDAFNLKSRLTERLAELETEEDRQRVKADIDRDLGLLEGARSRLSELKQLAGELPELIRSPEAQKPAIDPNAIPEQKPAEDLEAAEELVPVDQLVRRDLRDQILEGHQKLLQIVRSLSVVEIGLRVEQIGIPKFDMPQEQVILNSVENRVDLMNEKAAVMDARRKVEIQANALRSSLNLDVQGIVGNGDNNRPLDFASQDIQFQSGIRLTTPADRNQQRNDYRESLITYQRARRDYMVLEDTVKQGVRRNWRQLSVLRRNLETSRLQLRLAARQYDSAVDQSNAPAQVGGGGGSQGGVQGNLLIQALNSIVSAQNALIQNWITYEQNRLGIYRDMGMMEIGPDGIWNDPQYRGTSDQYTPEELPGRQILPDGGADDGTKEVIPNLVDPPGLGRVEPRRRRLGWVGETSDLAGLGIDGVQEGQIRQLQRQTG